MEFLHNVPSIEEISFKLTENVITSQAHLPLHEPQEHSLEYTLSRVSIQQMLYDDEQNSNTPPQTGFWNKSELKTTCAGTLNPSSIRKNIKTTFRQRVLTSHKSTEKPTFNRRLSYHVMNLEQDLKDTKSQAPLHSPHPAPYRAKQNKIRCISGKQFTCPEKLKMAEILELQSSMKVKPVSLEVHSLREKIYMRRLIQNRGSVLHAVEEISNYRPSLTHRKGYRIQ